MPRKTKFSRKVDELLSVIPAEHLMLLADVVTTCADGAGRCERRRIAKALREEAVIVVHVAAMYRTEGLPLDTALACVRAPRRGR